MRITLPPKIEGQDGWALGSPYTRTIHKLPDDLQSGDVVFMSPSGEIRHAPAIKWTQRAWNAIDGHMRRLLR